MLYLQMNHKSEENVLCLFLKMPIPETYHIHSKLDIILTSFEKYKTEMHIYSDCFYFLFF